MTLLKFGCTTLKGDDIDSTDGGHNPPTIQHAGSKLLVGILELRKTRDRPTQCLYSVGRGVGCMRVIGDVSWIWRGSMRFV